MPDVRDSIAEVIDSRRSIIFGLTFTVAFCSIVYELIYAEMLRIFFGGTVTQYAINIGLFMFGFGFGSFIYNYIDRDRVNFAHVETALATAGPVGLMFIIGINLTDPAFIVFGDFTGDDPLFLYRALETLPYIVSYLPVLLVGLLSGMEIPYLTDLADDEKSKTVGVFAPFIILLVRITPFMRLPDEDEERDSFSQILGVDYLGSLAGTVVYALVLFPTIGLIPSIFVLGFLNAVAALVFVLAFRRKWSWRATDLLTLNITQTSRVVFLVLLVLTGTYAGLITFNEGVEREVSETYIEGRMQLEWDSHNMQYQVLEQETTKYQRLTLYERSWSGSRYNWWGDTSDTCLRLDGQVQLCDSWVRPYHSGLVDVPMAFYNESERQNLDVLMIGGGDYIAVNHLRKYNATVDQVDIDGEFLNYTKNHHYFEQYHDNAYRYDKLDTHVGDAFTYLRDTNKTYDLVILDLPGAENDDATSLYSKEFYSLLRQRLDDDGLVVTWGYNRHYFARHYEVYMTTVQSAGFDQHFPYRSYKDVDGDGEAERVETYYVFSPGHTPEPEFAGVKDEYVQQHRSRYEDGQWRPVPRYRGTDVNSLFDPNYGILTG